MARSFYKVDDRISTAPPYFHEPSSTWYAMQRLDDGKLVQRRWRVDPDGNQIHVRQLSVDQVMGSGNHARSFLHQTARGALIELPFAWYAENGGMWGMSPGHDRDYTLPPRAIAYECMFCHNGYPQIPKRHDEPGAEPLYNGALPQGIDCQRCHGPGSAHVTKAQSGKASVEEIRSAILNPSRISSDRQMEVCMQCHLETTALPLPHSLVKFGRGPFSYDPREPLGDFINFFDHAPGSKHKEDFEIAHSAYRLRKSLCFVRSAGRMTCTTCHNPHDVPRNEQATAHYNAVCATCHPTTSVTHTKSADCISCHMQKRRTQDVIHAVMTDHWIQRRGLASIAPLQERAEFDANKYGGEVITYYPSKADPVLEATAQVTQKSNLAKGLPRLAAAISAQRVARHEPYVELGQAWVASGNVAKSIGPFEDALRRQPDSVAAMLSLGDALTQLNQPASAVTVLTRAITVAPNEPLLWYQLGLAHSKAGHEPDAEQALAKAASLDSDIAEVHNVLGGLLASRGDTQTAEIEWQKALIINPDSPDALANLGQLLGLRGKFTEATFYLGRSVKVRPGDADTRINYSVALASVGKLEEAGLQIDAAIKLAPQLPNVHFIKGSILEKQDQPGKALVEMQTAIRLRPDYVAAHLSAARILKAQGDSAAADMHLQKAKAASARNRN